MAHDLQKYQTTQHPNAYCCFATLSVLTSKQLQRTTSKDGFFFVFIFMEITITCCLSCLATMNASDSFLITLIVLMEEVGLWDCRSWNIISRSAQVLPLKHFQRIWIEKKHQAQQKTNWEICLGAYAEYIGQWFLNFLVSGVLSTPSSGLGKPLRSTY